MAEIKQIQFKRSSEAGKKPTTAQLAQGELAINTQDRVMYTKDHNDQIIDLGFAKGGTVTGDITQIGNYTQTGRYDLNGDMSVNNITSSGETSTKSVKVESQLTGRPLILSNIGGATKKFDQILSGTASITSLTFRSYYGAGETSFKDIAVFKCNPTTGVTSVSLDADVNITNPVVKRLVVNAAYDKTTTLGDQSITMGDSSTGLKWISAGRIDNYSNGISISKSINGTSEFTRKAVFRYASDAAGNTYSKLPINDALVTVDTSTDGNTLGNTFIGGTDADGKFSHYFRGQGKTHINTESGLSVSQLATFYGNIVSNATGNFITNVVAANQLGYIGGNVGTKVNAWQVGKTGVSGHITFSSNPGTTSATIASVILDPEGTIAFQTADQIIERIDKTGLVINGIPWSNTKSHAWSDQWATNPVNYVDFGTGPGAADLYMGYGVRQTIQGIGYGTRFSMGLLRTGSDWGTGVLAVYSSESAPSSAHPLASYQFKHNGWLLSDGFMSSGKGLALNTAGNTLGFGSISLGDPDSGIKWWRDGVYAFMVDNVSVATIEGNQLRTENGKALISYGDLNQANDAHSTYVRDVYIRSDIRVKSELHKFESPSETSKKINGYLYLQKKGFKEDGSINWEQSSGLIAQEVQAVLPELISVDKDNPEGLLRLNYNGIIALNTATINEHTDEISELKARIQKLEEIISTLI